MLDTLSSARATAGSVVFHGLVVMAAVWATVRPEVPISQRAAAPPGTWLLPPPEPGPPLPPPPLPDRLPLPDPEPGLLPPPEHWLPPPAEGAGPRDSMAQGDSRGFTRDPWPALDTIHAAQTVDEPPELLTARVPSYPELLRSAGVAGRVMVQAAIDTSGHAEPWSLKIVQSPHAGFNAAAIDYVRSAVFRPGRVMGRAVRVWVLVPIEFRLTR